MAKRVNITDLKVKILAAKNRQREIADQLRIENSDNPQVKELVNRIETKVEVLDDIYFAMSGNPLWLDLLAE